jgi:hypothetical protein
MITTMKKYLVLIVAFAVFSSCEDQLTLTSPSELTASGFWNTETGAKAAYTGLYANLRSADNTFWLLGEIRSDMWGGQTFESPFTINLIESNITVTTAPFNGWAGLYSNIHKVNDFIANVPNVKFNNETEKKNLLGQAYGLRAMYYYTLLKTWGAVPISTEPISNIDPSVLAKSRAPQTEIMSLIKSDIKVSLEQFGNDNSFYGGSRNYWSKAATLALKGDVYIWSGNLLGGGSADFTEAKTALIQIATMDVKLAESFDKLWGVSNENNKEFIFAIQYKQDEGTNIFNSLTGRGTEINPQFDTKGTSLSNFIIAGSNRYGPSEKTLNLLNDNKDSRKDETFIQLYKNGAGYPSFDQNNYFGAIFKKFLGKIVGTERIFDNDVPVYRYADVLLLLAEAKNRLGEDSSTEINQIRKRAYGANFNAATQTYVNGSLKANADAILTERYKEFIGEGKRWWDLRRAGDSYVIENVEFLKTGDEFKLLLPITLDMLGRNASLEQTPGYN